MTEYRIPAAFMISRSHAPRLYELEAMRSAVIVNAAAEWSKATGIGGVEGTALYRVALPQALFDTLEGFDSTSAMAAAMAFLIHAMEQDMRHGDEPLVSRVEAGLVELSENLRSVAQKWRDTAKEAADL